MQQTIICTKWGKRYPAKYANVLWSMIKRNTQRPTRLVCYTDDTHGLDPEIEAYPMPTINLTERRKQSTWRKIALWGETLEGLSGDVLYIDLDVVITSNIDAFFDYKPEAAFCVIENWTQFGSGICNTSVYRFKVGAHSYLFDKVNTDPYKIIDSAYPNSQTFISYEIQNKTFWPASWCQSFKHNLLPRWPLNLFRSATLPQETKVVCFTGHPDPDEALEGKWKAPWYKKIYKYTHPTPWIAEHWQ
ncbi:MAG: hypothetical protein AAF228_08275 [Pseudomonadota bacterium]